MAFFISCCEGWLLPDQAPGPLPRPGLRLTGIFVGVVAVGLLAAWLIGNGDAPDRAAVGAPAPDFRVELIGGGEFVLSEELASSDKPILLNLWASWCLPCREETPEISAFAEAHPDIKVIGVAVEDVESASRDFANEFRPAYDLALGTPEFEDAYPRLGLPVTYVISADGLVDDAFNGIVTIATLEDLFSG